MSDLQQMMATAQARAVAQGYSKRGTKTVVHASAAIELCKPDHWKWHPLGNPAVIRCGICHPPACEHVVIGRLADVVDLPGRST